MRARTLVVCGVALWGCLEPVTENVVGPSGGALHFGGAALFIPPGALESEVPFTALAVDVPPGAPRALGPAFDFGPDGVVFRKPVELHLRVDVPGVEVQVVTAPSSQGPWQRLPTRLSDGLAVVTLNHFSVYYPSESERDAGVDAGVADAGVVDAGVADAGVADAGAVDAGAVDAGRRDAGVEVDAGRPCVPDCTQPGAACDRSVGQCVFGYQALRIVEPLDGGVARVDAGTVTAVVELIPIAGLTPVPPDEVVSMLWFVISGTYPVFTPVADGGPWVSTFTVVQAPGAPYELSASARFDSFPFGDAGYRLLRDKVHFTTP